jgi:nicotinate phosphoribosyltransferase
MAPATKAKKPKGKTTKKESRRERVEKALEEGLKGTFPASDAVAVTEPVAPRPLSRRHRLEASEPSPKIR